MEAGCEGVAAINTIQSVMGINLETLRPEPSVEGYTTPGGYSCKAVKPIALAKVPGLSSTPGLCLKPVTSWSRVRTPVGASGLLRLGLWKA